MATVKIFNRTMLIGVCLAGLLGGCAPQGKPAVGEAEGVKPVLKKTVSKPIAPAAVKIELKSTAGQQSRYKIATQARRSINWEGPVPTKDVPEESFNDDKVEMVITQSIQRVNPNGGAVAKVTFDSLKNVSILKKQTIVDFDSSRLSDVNHRLAGLIGKGWTIEFEPNNYISGISDLAAIRALVKGRSNEERAGQNILMPETIKERQSTLVLPPGPEAVKPGDKWSTIKTFPFGMLGIKSYEKIWTLKEVKEVAGHKIAVIDMKAIPSTEVESKYREENPAVPKMFDTNETYTGRGEVDLTAGCIDSYSENLNTSWFAAIPTGSAQVVDPNKPAETKEPVVLRMTAMRSYLIEKIKSL